VKVAAEAVLVLVEVEGLVPTGITSDVARLGKLESIDQVLVDAACGSCGCC